MIPSNHSVPAQCVLLDYSRCKNHRDKNGVPTDINHEELCQILAVESKEWKAINGGF